VRLPLSDAGPAKQFLEHCDEIGPRSPVPITKNPDGSCTVGPIPEVGISGTVWIDGNTVRAAKAKGTIGKGIDGAAPSAAARELADYTFAYWGRGSMIGADIPGMPPEARVALAAMGYFSELGMGVKFRADGFSVLMVARTIHANPDDVVAEIEAAIGAGADTAKVQAIAKAHPGTPFAEDVTAGPMGVMAPTATIGVLAAVAIPAFLGYKKQGAASPADLALNRIVKSAKTYYIMNAKFPEGDSGLTPAVSACMVPGKRHMPNPDPWMNNPIWSALEFSVEDPDYFQYHYQGTATEFTATAIGDLDCDLTGFTKIIARGTIDPSGNPVVDVTKETDD
jgi:hypothetical protein